MGTDWVKNAVSPLVLGQIGRDLIRTGESLHVIDVDSMGRVSLLTPALTGILKVLDTRTLGRFALRSMALLIPRHGICHIPPLIFTKWGSTPGQPYQGTGPAIVGRTRPRKVTV